MDLNETARVEEVNRFMDIDFKRSTEFQSIVNMAADVCGKPIAFLTLLDDKYNWFKVMKGVEMERGEKQTSFCQYAIQSSETMVIPDASKDTRVSDNPLVTGETNVRFYASSPLVTDNGQRIGTLCVFDFKPGELSAHQQQILEILSRQVMYLMEMEKNEIQLRDHIDRVEQQNQALQQIAYIQSHEIRHPLTTVLSLVNLGKTGVLNMDEKWVEMLFGAASTLDKRIKAIVSETYSGKNIKLARFNRMVHEIEDYAILLLDDTGRIENWNLGAELVKGYREEEIVGKNFSVFYPSVDIANGKPEKLIAEAKQLGKAKDEGWRIRKNGDRFWASVVITAIHDDVGKVIGFTKVTKDLGDQPRSVGISMATG